MLSSSLELKAVYCVACWHSIAGKFARLCPFAANRDELLSVLFSYYPRSSSFKSLSSVCSKFEHQVTDLLATMMMMTMAVLVVVAAAIIERKQSLPSSSASQTKANKKGKDCRFLVNVASNRVAISPKVPFVG